MKTTKLLLLSLALVVCASSAISQTTNAPWSRFKTFRFGHQDSTDNASFDFRDGKFYVQDFFGNRYYDLVFRDAEIRRILADSLLRGPHIQAGTGFGSPPSYALEVIGGSWFYGDVYLWEGYTLGSYSGNGARIKFVHATGTQILNNKGIAFQIAQNADVGALLVDSAYISVSRPIHQGASDTVATQAYARSFASAGGGLVAADSVSMRNYSNSLYLKNADSTTLKNSLLKNADSTSLRNYSNSLYLKNADSTTLKNSLLKNADSTKIRNYSNTLYLKNADSTTMKNSLLKNADSTSIRNYSNSLYLAKATVRTLFSAGLIDSVKTSDTVFVGWVYPAATIDSVIYSGARSQSLTARLELVDSLYQTAAGTLVDTTTCTLQKTRRAAAVGGGTFTLTAAKILRMVFPVVGTMPKQFNVTVVGH